MDEFKLEQNKTLVDAKFNFYQPPLKDAIMNATIKSLVVFTGATIYVTVSFPATPHDKDYNKVFLKTVVDIKRVLGGVYANPILKSAMVNLLSALDFEIRFPFPVVSIVELSALKLIMKNAGHLQHPKFFAH